MSIAIAANGMAYDASTGLFAYQPRRRTWWQHGNGIELSVIAWPTTNRVLHRIEQCHRMIAAHKATAELVRIHDIKCRCLHHQPQLNGQRYTAKYFAAIPHVIAAYRYLGVRL